MARVDSVQTFAFLPKPMKKLKSMARKSWKVAMMAASWSMVLSVRHIFIEYFFAKNKVATITAAQRAMFARKIISPPKAVGTIRLVTK